MNLHKVVLLASVLGTTAFPWAPAPQVFQSTTDGVILDVSVRDGNRPVPGLRNVDFELRDNGVRQSQLDVTAETLPLDVTLTFDLSASLSPAQVDRLWHAVDQIAGALRPGDRSRAVGFTRRVHERSPMGPVLTVVPMVSAPENVLINTALFDAIALTVIHPPTVDRRSLAVVLTDGFENMSFLDSASVIDAIRRTDTVLDVLIARRAGPGSATSGFLHTLQEVAGITGGRYLVLDQGEEVGAAFLREIDDFRASYILRYSPTGVPREGWHDIAVKVIKSGGQHYTIRTRKGYVG
jgi:hypothetical protein